MAAEPAKGPLAFGWGRAAGRRGRWFRLQDDPLHPDDLVEAGVVTEIKQADGAVDFLWTAHPVPKLGQYDERGSALTLSAAQLEVDQVLLRAGWRLPHSENASRAIEAADRRRDLELAERGMAAWDELHAERDGGRDGGRG